MCPPNATNTPQQRKFLTAQITARDKRPGRFLNSCMHGMYITGKAHLSDQNNRSRCTVQIALFKVHTKYAKSKYANCGIRGKYASSILICSKCARGKKTARIIRRELRSIFFIFFQFIYKTKLASNKLKIHHFRFENELFSLAHCV